MEKRYNNWRTGKKGLKATGSATALHCNLGQVGPLVPPSLSVEGRGPYFLNLRWAEGVTPERVKRAEVTVKRIKFLKVEKEPDDSGQAFLCMGNSKPSAAQGSFALKFCLRFGTDKVKPVATPTQSKKALVSLPLGQVQPVMQSS